jgi:hypothetical protein
LPPFNARLLAFAPLYHWAAGGGLCGVLCVVFLWLAEDVPRRCVNAAPALRGARQRFAAHQ